jgi:predicted unusual protein kinase regulating ubiquinone biosynthesis (AarF/ABC1/UbiB family)
VVFKVLHDGVAEAVEADLLALRGAAGAAVACSVGGRTSSTPS